MRCIGWNCRGLGAPRAVRALKEVLRTCNPQLVGLIETKVNNSRWERLKLQLGFRNCFMVERRGLAGGLALLWNDDVDVSILNFSTYHIDAIVKGEEEFRATLFYGDPVVSRRVMSWELLRRLYDLHSMPWIVFGDFNEVVYSHEVKGGRGRSHWQMTNFRRALEDCDLSDLCCEGPQFSFSNRRKGQDEVQAKLDRVVVNQGWRMLFPKARARYIAPNSSDHLVVFIDTDGRTKGRRKRMFRFEEMWLKHPGFKRDLHDFWKSQNGNRLKWAAKLKNCSQFLKSWNSMHYGDIRKKIEKLKEELEEVKREDRTEEIVAKERSITEELDDWLAKEEVMWKQRARVEWIKYGDRNTAFFHARASQRRKRNWIHKLIDSQGVTVTSNADLATVIGDYFKDIFCSSLESGRVDWEKELCVIQPRITTEMNENLIRGVTDEEIRRAVFQLGATKAPGCDGYPAIFFQSNWDLIRDELVGEVRSFFREFILDKDWNTTQIVLVPKVKDVSRMTELRPISLCNVSIKVITKILANRIQPIIGEVISFHQSAFIKNRMIFDNFIIAHELAHYIKGCKNKKRGYASLKLDMSKAYDRIEWSLLEQIMRRMGFSEVWIRWIMLCVSTVQYRVKFNDVLTDEIIPSRGLRQGDPLSPYLFILCMELLDAKLADAVNKGLLSGVKISRSAPGISHLFFADDAIMFFKANTEQAILIKNIIKDYERISGQKVNYDKSEVVFSPNIEICVKREVVSVLGVNEVERHGKYLGLPLIVGQRKCEVFKEIVEKTWRKTVDWKHKLLSIAGREVLVKSVLQSLPLYTMAVFLLPQKIRDELSKIMLNFWWNCQEGKGGHWINRRILMEPKVDGGLGFKDLKYFNEALVMRLCWRIIKYPELLLSRVLKGRYFPYSDFATANIGYRASSVWQSIMKVREVFLRGVEQPIEGHGYRWNQSSKGEFTTSSAYLLSKSFHEESNDSRPGQSDRKKWNCFWKTFWSSKVPNKVKFFNWRYFYNCLPDAENLARRGVLSDISCKVCGAKQENMNHLVKRCWWSKCLWNLMGLGMEVETLDSGDGADMLWWFVFESDKDKLKTFLVGNWLIWKNRNEIWHDKQGWDPTRASLYGIYLLQSYDSNSLFGSVDVNLLASYWRKSHQEEFVVNVDGSWSSVSGKMGMGVICRDSSGVVRWAVAKQIYGGSCASEAEGRALEWASELVEKEGLSPVLFEVDSTDVAEALVYQSASRQWSSGWLASTLSRFLKWPNWRVSLIQRERNGMADSLARKACLESWNWNNKEAIPLAVCSAL
ncbi:unnamed protein product [Rhodiola kirilowii]